MDFDQCIVTDESRRSDFGGCGLPDEIAGATDSLQALHAAWDEWVVERIAKLYSIEVSPSDALVDIFDQHEAGSMRQGHTTSEDGC